ncbi:MAG TPA: alpha/beta hydrolase [Kofleriaceae bacterium]|nr:alpha/beta hydrolase [Kofleriaceae bacterium]
MKIDEQRYLRIGGIDQWVMIRGEDVTNPVLVVLHGGPGMSDTGFLRHFDPALEASFTVVYWDQRGTGKSFDAHIPRSSMTVEQFISDLDELVDHVRGRLGTAKVALLGHSWGSALGVLYAARFPDKVAAYVGCAQIGDWAAGEAGSYAYAVAEAHRRGDRKAEQKLRAIGPPPHSADALWVERMTVARLEGRMGFRELWRFVPLALRGLFTLPRAIRGFRFSIASMWAEVSRLNLFERVPALPVPVVIFVGGNDHWVPPEASIAYFDALIAPSKQLVRFEHSGHEVFVDEPAKFDAAMRERVRPLLTAKAVPPAVSAGRW